MKPKLIILNGPLGIGKSTLASRFADDHPNTLRLDIDDIRRNISHWREQAEQSAISSKQMSLAMARVHLGLGHDVVVAQIVRSVELFNEFEQITKDTNADYYEVLLFTDKDEAIRRFKERSYAQGHASGFRPGGLIDTGGREEKLAIMYDEMIETANQRPNTIKIEPELDKEDATYRELLEKIGDSPQLP